MAKSYYTVLEVTSMATPGEIRSAYRRLAKEYHPDHYTGGSKPFRQVQEAYAVLGNPDRRRAYEKTLSEVRVKRTPRFRTPQHRQPEPLIPEPGPVDMGEISPVRSFKTFFPSFDEIFDGLWNNFSSIDHPKSGKFENLTLEVTLTRQQAMRGGKAKVMVPARSVCPICQGHGNTGYYECHRCVGQGVISSEVPISIAFPPGLTKDHSVIIALDRFGINNFHLTVLLRPRDVD